MANSKPSARRNRSRIVTVFVVAMSVAMLGACSKGKTVAEYIATGKTQRDGGNYPAAIISFKNALQQEPKNQTARALLAQTYLDMSNGAEAEAELTRAKQEGADPAAIEEPVAEADLLQGRPEKVLTETDPPPGASSAVRAGLLSLRGRALTSLGRMDEARAALDLGLQADPHSAEVLAAMAMYSAAQRDMATARDRVAAAEKESPKDMKLVALQGAVDFAAGEFAESEQSYQRVVTAQAWNLSARLGLARAQIGAGKLQEANATLAIILKSASKDPNTNYLRALAAYRGKDYANALSYSETTLGLSKDYVPALLIAGGAAYGLDRFEQANSYLNRYLFRVPDNVQARKLLAAVQMRMGRPADAVKTLSPAVDKSDGDAQLLAMIGTAAVRSGDLAGANRYLSEAVKQQPDNAALRTELGVTEISLGQTDTGIDELEKAAQQDPNALGPDVALILTHLRSKDYDKALDVAERMQKNRPDDPIGYDYAGVIEILKGDPKAGEAALLKARELRPGDPMALRNLATLAIKDGKFDVANGYYDEILKANPKDSRAYISEAELEARAGKPEETEAKLKQAIEQSPDDVAPRVVLARLYLVEGKPQPALETVQPVIAKNPNNPALLEVTGRAQLALHQFDAAIGTFRTLVEAAPQASASHRLLAEAYTASKQFDAALLEARKAVEVAPADPAAQMSLARLLTGTGQYDEARKIVDDLGKKYPKNVEVPELGGLIALAQYRFDDAIVAFQNALAIRENSVDRTRLSIAQSRSGHPEQAEKTLSTWLDAHPDDIVVRMGLGDLYTAINRNSDAETQYAEILRQKPNDVAAENNLAWVLSRLNQTSEALEHARHAATAAPSNPQVLDTLGVILLQSQKGSEAVQTLQNASKAAPAAPEIQFHLAQALVSTGKKDEARDILEKVLGANQLFPDREQAQKLLTELRG
jgi:putative PEP-CTERM system TPR-repeat lipoprotein